MVDLTRRKTVIGLGLLATGSGATFTSAAFQSSTQQDSDLRVVVDQNLQFGKNPDLDPDDVSNITGDPDFFEDGELNEDDDGPFDQGNEGNGSDPSNTNGSDIDGEDGFDPNYDNEDGGFNEGFEPQLPKAFAGTVDGEFTIKAAVQIGESARFEELLQVSNATDSTVQVGIAYDRTGQGVGGNGNYGEDVEGSGLNTDLDKLKRYEAQKIYQFQVSSGQGANYNPSNDNTPLISPAPGETGEDGSFNNEPIENSGDRPSNLVEVPPGEEVNIDLVVNTKDDTEKVKGDLASEDVEQDILDAADIDQGAFGFQTDTVQVIDVITVVSQPEP